MSNPSYETRRPAPGPYEMPGPYATGQPAQGEWPTQSGQPEPFDMPGPGGQRRGPGPRSQPDSNEDNTLLWFARMAKVFVWFIYAVTVALLIILTLGFILRLLGANPEAGFAEWVYRNDQRIMEPFRGMFPTETIGDQSVVDFSLLFGMIFYAIVAMLLHTLISWLSRKATRLARGENVWA